MAIILNNPKLISSSDELNHSEPVLTSNSSAIVSTWAENSMSNSTLKLVDHTYRDFSTYLDDGGRLFKHKKCHKNFPAQLHKILSDPEHSEIITWMPHGRAFKVLNKEVFVSSVMSKYTTCSKYESYTRQLNSWGFKRLYQTGPDQGCYYHECFLRGLPKLTTLILRLPPNMGKTTPYPVGEPNFYLLSEQFPLPPLSSSSTSSRLTSAAVSSTTSSTSVASAASSETAIATNQTQDQSRQLLALGVKPAVQESVAQYHDQSSSASLTQESVSSLTKDELMEPLPLHAHQFPSLPPYAGSSSVMLPTNAQTSHHFPHRPHTWNFYPPPVHDGQHQNYYSNSPPPYLPRYQEISGQQNPAVNVPYPTIHRPYVPLPPYFQAQYYQQQHQSLPLHHPFDSSSFHSPHHHNLEYHRFPPPTTAVEEHRAQIGQQQQQKQLFDTDNQNQFHTGQQMLLPPQPPAPPPYAWESRCHDVGNDSKPN